MRRLERGNDALEFTQYLQRFDDDVVADRDVTGPAAFGEVGVFGPDARVVEARRDGVRLFDLTVIVLEQERSHAVQHAGLAETNSRAARRLDANELGR